MTTSPIFVTKPSLPPLEQFIPLLEKIWETKTITHLELSQWVLQNLLN